MKKSVPKRVSKPKRPKAAEEMAEQTALQPAETNSANELKQPSENTSAAVVDAQETAAAANEESKFVTKEELSQELGLSQEYADEKLSEAMQTMAPKKRKRSIIVSLVFLLINIVFMAFIMTNLLPSIGGDIWSTIASRGGNLWWLLGGGVMYVIYILVQVLMFYELIKSLTGKKRFKLSYDVALVGKYYENITPFAVGGQPMQIVRLASNGVSAGLSTSIPIMKMLLNNFVNMIVALLFFIFGLPALPMTNHLNSFLMIIFIVLGVIGLIITIIVTLFLILLSTGSFVTRSFISGVLRLGYKLKIVKNYRQTLRKTINQVAEYRNSVKYLWKNKKLFFKMIILCVCECISYAMIVYFVVRAFAVNDSVVPLAFVGICILKFYICEMASSFIPLPGGTGLMEITFIFMFFFEVGDFIALALLIWRFMSYYSVLIHGFVHEMIKIGRNFAKNRKAKQT